MPGTQLGATQEWEVQRSRKQGSSASPTTDMMHLHHPPPACISTMNDEEHVSRLSPVPMRDSRRSQGVREAKAAGTKAPTCAASGGWLDVMEQCRQAAGQRTRRNAACHIRLAAHLRSHHIERHLAQAAQCKGARGVRVKLPAV